MKTFINILIDIVLFLGATIIALLPWFALLIADWIWNNDITTIITVLSTAFVEIILLTILLMKILFKK